MKVLKFKCTLLSDVILNRKSATTGPNETLDFIPGSNFLGIAAGALYSELEAKDALTLFHSGKVRFGDANPSMNDFRGLKVPAEMFYPKLSKPDKELYIRYLIPATVDVTPLQLKQCRNGFYDFSEEEAKLIETKTDFAVKSAYDRNVRRSKDEQMFGYQSLRKGLVFYFSVEIDDDRFAEEMEGRLVGALVGNKRIGRSRTAQYGLVKIEKLDYREVGSGEPKDNKVTVYADGRLIFLDKNGMPTFQPTAEQLGLDGGKIVWKDSEIRTFCYAPWNFKRQCFDTDRCGIEKGSVFVVEIDGTMPQSFESRYVGAYQNEGFGRVIYNPDFLEANGNGEAEYRLDNDWNGEDETPDDRPHADYDRGGTPDDRPHAGDDRAAVSGYSSALVNYLRERRASERDIYKAVNDCVQKWEKERLFKGDRFASQWWAIRSLATSVIDFEALKKALFDAEVGYLTHGVAKEKWADRGRLKEFREFVKKFDREPEFARHAIVNLAAEMAKKCKED
ncbi:MAG: hypothetical protein K2H47_09635 [Muribaculaceae bacterium]|nr:hypothetical protein [Muribaculaceae bacterium]